nr:unnamed protein product [Leishmania braziliensis]
MVAHEARAPALQRVGTPEEPRVGLVATTHRVRLDGDAWARVLEACPDLLKQEFTSDVCDATSLPPTSMRRLVLAAGSLVADFELAHGGLARTELDEQIARSPFTRTWALYQRVAAPEETLAPRAATLEEAPMVVVSDVPAEHELSQRTAEPVGFSRDDLASAGPAALQRVGTPEEPRVGLVATTHRVRLDGDAWARVLEACPDLLKQEFTSDVCDATSLPPTSMRRLVLAAGSLVADFELAHGGLAGTELDEQIARSPFTRTWALYQRVAAPEETLGPRAAPLPQDPRASRHWTSRSRGCAAAGGDAGWRPWWRTRHGPPALQRVGTPEEPRVGLVATTHRVRLDGDAWARVLEACPDLLKREFTSDVCDATSLPPTSMRRLVLAAGSLVADFELAHGGLARTELDEQIARSPFTRTWALYQRVAAPEETLAPRAATLEEAPMVVVSDVPAEHELSQRTAEPVGFSRDDLASAGPAALQRVGTPEEPRVGLVATTHRVRLDGDAWARVLEACPDLLKQEFTSDVCDATSLPPTSMRRLVLAAGSLVADFELAHGGLAGTELDEQIARSPFTRTWALYQRVAAPEETLAPRAAPPAALQDSESFASLDVEEPPAVLRREGTPEVATMVAHEARAPALQRVGTPEEPRVGLVATTHRVRLDGDAWARVLEACPDLLKQEFTSDVCDATSLPPTSMRRLVLAAGSLVADFELAHGGLARTELDEQIARSPFTRTWALYQRVAAPEETLGPRAATLEEAPMVVVSDVPAEHELSQRTAKPSVLRRDGMVESRVVSEGDAMGECCHADGDDVIFFLEADGLSGDVLMSSPRVVLRASSSSLSVSVSVAEGSYFRGITRHRVTLEGRYWVMVISSPLLAEAFRLDVANALNVASEDVQHLELVAGSLVGTFAVVHSCDLLTTAEADEKLRAYHFPLTWAQYPETPDTAAGHFFEREALTTIRRSSRPVSSVSKRLVAPADTELLLTASGRRTPQRLPVVSQEASRSVLSSCAQTHSAPMIASVELETLFVASTVHEALPLSEKQTSTSDLPFPVCLEKINVSEPSMKLRGCTGPAPLVKEVQGSNVPETVSTKHRVGFVGHWWTVILKTHKDDFVAAFVRDTDEKLGYAPDSVDKVQCNEDTGDTIVTFRVTHPSTLLSKNIDLLLRSAPYADVWALYYKYAPSGAQEETCIGVTTYHRVGFVGSKWKDVLGRDMARFKDAFAADTATALNITPQVVRIADYAVADDIVVAFYVTHSVTDSEQAVDAKLELFNYQRVWDLYGNLNEMDELQRVVPCVMKRSPASHHTSSSLSGRPWAQHTSSVSATGGFCPNCRGSFSPQQEFLQLGESGGWQAQSVHSHCSSSGDAVHTTLMEDNYLAIRRSPRTPPIPQLARRFTSHARSEMKTSQSSSVQHRGGTSIAHGAQMTPRPPWYPSTNSSHIPHPPRQHSFSNTTRHLQRRVNLRELESELSHKQRKRKYQERQEQLDREMRRSLNCSRSSHSTGANTSVPRGFLPHIPVRYTRVRPNLQHTKNGLGHPLE